MQYFVKPAKFSIRASPDYYAADMPFGSVYAKEPINAVTAAALFHAEKLGGTLKKLRVISENESPKEVRKNAIVYLENSLNK